MYLDIVQALKEAESNDQISMFCITGAGDYFSSGNDLRNYSLNVNNVSIEELFSKSRDLIE